MNTSGIGWSFHDCLVQVWVEFYSSDDDDDDQREDEQRERKNK